MVESVLQVCLGFALWLGVSFAAGAVMHVLGRATRPSERSENTE